LSNVGTRPRESAIFRKFSKVARLILGNLKHVARL
jgi:hypothetical protein